MKKSFKVFVFLVFLISLIVTIYSAWRYFNYYSVGDTRVRTYSRKQFYRIKDITEKFYSKIILDARNLQNKILKNNITQEQIEQEIKEILASNKNIYNFNISYFKDTDNKDKHESWYQDSLKDLKEGWVNIYFNKAIGQYLLKYKLPILKINNNNKNYDIVGFIFVDTYLTGMSKVFEEQNIDRYLGFFLATNNGDLVYHQVKSFIGTKNIKDLANIFSNKSYDIIYQKFLEKKDGFFLNRNKDTELLEEFIYNRLSKIDLNLCLVFSIVDSVYNNKTLRFIVKDFVINLSFFIFILILTLMIFLQDKIKNSKFFWSCSIFTSLVFIIFIIIFLKIYLSVDPKFINVDNVSIENQEKLEKLLRAQYADLSIEKKESLKYLKAGIFVENLDKRPAGFNLVGNLWYKCDLQNIFLQDPAIFIGSKDLKFNKVYDITQEKDKIFGWNFNAIIPSDSKENLYPFDRHLVKIQLRTPDYNKSIVFMPDFDSFSYNSSNIKNILKNNYDGWEVEHSFWSYDKTNYSTNFGISNSVLQKNFPELSLNFVLLRNSVILMIGHIFPILLVLFILFVIIILSSIEIQNLSLISLAASYTSLILSIIFSHQTVHAIMPLTITYAESFFLAAYFIIFIMLVLTLLVKFNIIKPENNFWIKISYWPLVTAIFWILTILFFY